MSMKKPTGILVAPNNFNAIQVEILRSAIRKHFTGAKSAGTELITGNYRTIPIGKVERGRAPSKHNPK